MTKLVRTCDACPTQYDIHLDDGRYVYFRYRHGYWSLELYPDPDAFWNGDALASLGDEYVFPDGTDGFMSHSEVMVLLEIALPALLQKASS